jgi:hypothetical protein
MQHAPIDPETLRIPAYLRKKAIVSQSKQKLILTALDRKMANLSPHSTRATASTPVSRTAASRTSSRKPSYKKNYLKTPRPISRSRSPYLPKEELQTPVSAGKIFKQIGVTTHYLDKISVAIIKLSAQLRQGDLLLIQGSDQIFMQQVEEMQIDRQPVIRAQKDDHIGLKVLHQVKIDGEIYKIEN